MALFGDPETIGSTPAGDVRVRIDQMNSINFEDWREYIRVFGAYLGRVMATYPSMEGTVIFTDDVLVVEKSDNPTTRSVAPIGKVHPGQIEK